MKKTMKALVKTQAAKGLTQEQVPVPVPGPNDVLIAVKKSAICGTDMHIWDWNDWAAKTIPVPMVVGHEYAGVVAVLGDAVQGLEIGDRVTSEGHIVCGHCRNCRAGREHLCRNTAGIGVNRPGSFAEYVCVPNHNVYAIPDDISDDLAAIMDPYGNAVHTAHSFDLVGEDVLITGAGPIGAMAAAICRQSGARHIVITDMNHYRLDLASRMGATRAVDVTKTELRDVMDELGMTEGFDVGLEMSGAEPAFRQMLSAMINGGKIALLGLPSDEVTFDLNEIIFKSLLIKGIYGREMFDTWYKGFAMLQSGLDLGPVLTHEFHIDNFAQGFATMASGESGKVILNWE